VTETPWPSAEGYRVIWVRSSAQSLAAVGDQGDREQEVCRCHRLDKREQPELEGHCLRAEGQHRETDGRDPTRPVDELPEQAEAESLRSAHAAGCAARWMTEDMPNMAAAISAKSTLTVMFIGVPIVFASGP